jgi:hypothetical protein
MYFLPETGPGRTRYEIEAAAALSAGTIQPRSGIEP